MHEFKVDQQSAAVAAMATQWPLIDALVGGTATMRAAGKTLLPQWPSEPEDAYSPRLASAVLFNAFGHTSSVLAAKPFARPVTLENVPSRVEALLDNIDLYGTDLHIFSGQTLLACLQHGLMGVLVDYPPAQGVRTKAEELNAGLRPYLTQYPAKSILGWHSERNADGSFLTQLRLLETVNEPEGEFGEKITLQVRVLTPGAWQTWRKAKNAGGLEQWVPYEGGTTSLKVIPFVFFYGIRDGFGIGKPPLLDLAYLNVEHWQSSSDQQTILHAARVPILFAKGFNDTDKIVIGASTAATSTNEKAELEFVEHTGAAVEAGRQSILDLEDRMRQAGAELLVQRPSVQTATQVTSEDEGGRSTLQKIVEEFEDSIECCLQLMGEWLGEKSDPKVILYKDFGSANLSEKTGDLLLRAGEGESPHLSSETIFGQLKRMDVVPPNLAWDDEKLRLAKQRRRRTRAAAAQNKDPAAPAAE